MNSPRFNNALAALVKGYLKGTLVKGHCAACAVGNIVSFAIGDEIERKQYDNVCLLNRRSGKIAAWQAVFMTMETVSFGVSRTKQHIHPENYEGRSKDEIDATGYTWEELAKVELAFESATKIPHTSYGRHTPEAIDADQLLGLYAVVQVLCEIEGITDTAPYKAQFDKSLPLELV